MISLSKNILEKFPGSEHLYINILQKGCAGNKIEITNIKPEKGEMEIISHNLGEKITIWGEKLLIPQIDNSTITLANDSWIFSHKENILTRCGCGKSFSLKTGNAMKDKITLLKAQLKKSKHHN